MAVFDRFKDGALQLVGRVKSFAKARSSRFWWWVLGVPVGLYAFYVAGAIAFVRLGGMTRITQGEEDVQIDASSGYSLYPGRFHLTGLQVQFKDYNVEMAMSADEADLSINLFSLTQKRIHVHWVRASGVEFQMLHRVKDPKKSAARLAAFPDIVAFDRPPFYDTPRPPRTGKKQWSLRVDSIEAEARFAWVMEFQLRGKMRAKGAFYTDPAHKAEVLPCDVKVSEGILSVGQEQIAHDVQGDITFALAPFIVRDAPITKVMPKISAKIGDFTARIDSLSFTKLYFSTEPLSLSGQGQLEVDTTVTHGKVQPGSLVSLEISPLIVSAQGEGKDKKVHSARGHSQLSMRAAPGGHVALTGFVQIPSAKDGAFSAEKLEARAALLHSDITDIHVRGLQADLKALHLDRPDFLYALFGHSALIPMSGTFNFHGEADLPKEGTSQLEAKLQMLRTSFYLDGQRFGATADTSVSCRGTRKASDCEVDFHAPYLRLDKQADGEGEDLWLRLKTQEALQVSAENGTFQGPIVISGGDPRDVLSEWLGKVWFPQMGLKLVPTGPITGSMYARKSPSTFSLSDIDVSTGKTRLEGEMTTGKTTTALGTLKMPTSRWGFEITPEGVRVRPFIGDKWLDKQ